MNTQNTTGNTNQINSVGAEKTLDLKVSSSVLQRLMQEVKNDSFNNISAYNRTHNRHNRGR